MRNRGLIVFAVISLMVHVTAAAIFISRPDIAMEERGAGSAALEVGALFDSVAQEEVQPAETREPEIEERLNQPHCGRLLKPRPLIRKSFKPQLCLIRLFENSRSMKR